VKLEKILEHPEGFKPPIMTFEASGPGSLDDGCNRAETRGRSGSEFPRVNLVLITLTFRPTAFGDPDGNRTRTSQETVVRPKPLDHKANFCAEISRLFNVVPHDLADLVGIEPTTIRLTVGRSPN
jgi:hypothetical protein